MLKRDISKEMTRNAIISYACLALLFIIMAGCLLMITFRKKDPTAHIKESAKIALNANVDDVESVRIKTISGPDSVFGKRVITPEEMNAVGNMIMKVGDSISKRTFGAQEVDLTDTKLNNLMNRQMSAMTKIRQFMDYDMAEQPVAKGEFSGWKVKIDYLAKSKEGDEYHSQYWAILDKTGTHVVNSFEIPII